MKHIEKMEEPEDLVTWKANDKMYQRNQPKWNRLRSADKQPVHVALLKEQGGICCYCGTSIELDTSHIEHFRPREFFPNLQLEYDNLLCSCQRELQKEEPIHCGKAKGSWFEDGVTISPLDPNCETLFEYSESGHIAAIGYEHGADATITHLNLDDDKLVELRKAAIGAAIDGLDTFQEEEIQKMIETYSQQSPATNRFQPFCIAIVQVLLNI